MFLKVHKTFKYMLKLMGEKVFTILRSKFSLSKAMATQNVRKLFFKEESS